MKISIIGIRGISVIYSGFESFITNFAPDLVKRNFDVNVYCRIHYYKDLKLLKYKGVSLIYLPTIKNKYFETFIHSLLSTIHSIFILKPKLIYFLGVGNAPFVMLSRLFGIKAIINVDGIDCKREKWNWFGKQYLRLCQIIAVKCAYAVITDSKYMQRYYLKYYKKETIYIPYGFYPEFKENKHILKKYYLEKNKYYFWVGRFVPDNHLEELLEAFLQLKTSFKCVIVGDSNYEDNYKKNLFKWKIKDKRIIFTGFLKRNDYLTLLKNAFCYVETKRSGGTHPSLIEAIGYGSFILSNDHKANREILGNDIIFYNNKKGYKDLLNKIKDRENFRKDNASKKYTNQFDQKDIISEYIFLFNNILQK